MMHRGRRGLADYSKPCGTNEEPFRLASAVANHESGLSGAVREPGGLLLGQIAGPSAKIEGLESRLRASAHEDEEARRLMSIPGAGALCAM